MAVTHVCRTRRVSLEQERLRLDIKKKILVVKNKSRLLRS